MSEEACTPTTAKREPLLTISLFARRARLSPKALRLYDRLGLLPPVRVDPQTGYRYYAEVQLADARLIVLLRQLQMPLTQITAVLAASGADRATLIADYWRNMETQFARQRSLTNYILDRLCGNIRSLTMLTMTARDVPAQTLLTEQRHVTAGDLPQFIMAAMGRLLETASQHGGVIAAPLVIYHGQVDEDNDGPVEVCVPIAADRATAAIATREEPAHHEAYTTITKSQVAFPQILTAYDAVENWIAAQGRQQAGSPREIYLADVSAAGPDDLVCEIAYPISTTTTGATE